MTITNHVLAGSIIGLTVVNPVLAIALALASHFVMDMLPHFGYAGRGGYMEVLRHRLSYIVAVFTAITTVLVIILLAANSKWFALLTGLVAASPDAVGIYNWLAYEKYGKQAKGLLRLVHVRFHRAIQWCERPWGVILEVVTTTVLLFVLWGLLD